MKIELREIAIREVADGYIDDAEKGVVGYGGRLNIRPAFQREFIYKEKQRDAVIHTVRRGFPLNVMYWTKNQSGGFELMDGQQRTISICQFVNNKFSIVADNGIRRNFSSLAADLREKFLDYPLMVYFCEGTESEKLDWFRVINIAGEKLTEQEMRNAVFSGEWVTAAKKFFSKTGCPAYQIGEKYLRGSAIRQDYLETALGWIAARDGATIDEYMTAHHADTNCNEIKLYFKQVIDWVEAVFPPEHYRKEMKGLDWGIFYNKFGNQPLDPAALEEKIATLMMDDDITSKRGIYEYLLDGEEKHLAIRAFSPAMRRAAFERQKGKCAKCRKQFPLEEMQADHITPWSKGGKTIPKNCQMLCADCNRRKSDV